MAKALVSDEEFLALWGKYKSASKVAKYLGTEVRAVYGRRARLQQRIGRPLESEHIRTKQNFRQIIENVTGPVIVFSDLHAWPGEASPAFFALLELIRELKPKLIINGGDAFDGARISRHPPGGFLNLPEVQEELEWAKTLLKKIEDAAPKNATLIWTAGNHDSRFTTRLAMQAPEFAKVKGFDLKDHFEKWSFCWSCVINPKTPSETWVKHRWHGGVHAAYNNKIKVGSVNFCSGHTHALEAKPFTDCVGRRWGIQTGTLSPLGVEAGDKFSYGEDNCTQACQGFVVLHFTKDRLLPPELVETLHGTKEVWWRGKKVEWKKE